MKRLHKAASFLFLALGAVVSVPAQESARSPVIAASFAKADGIDFAKIMPAPPAPGSLAAQADLEAVLQAQAWRTPEQIAWAIRVDRFNIYVYADVLGAWFTKANLPVSAKFFDEVLSDAAAAKSAAKKRFVRPRPFMVDPRVQPCVGRYGANDSYPSGHAFDIYLCAAVLAELFPDKGAELSDFAHRLAWGRVIGGVHFPTDTVAGRLLAEAFLAKLEENPDFFSALEQCRREIEAHALPKAA